jgi:hypothetical protein
MEWLALGVVGFVIWLAVRGRKSDSGSADHASRLAALESKVSFLTNRVWHLEGYVRSQMSDKGATPTPASETANAPAPAHNAPRFEWTPVVQPLLGYAGPAHEPSAPPAAPEPVAVAPIAEPAPPAAAPKPSSPPPTPASASPVPEPPASKPSPVPAPPTAAPVPRAAAHAAPPGASVPPSTLGGFDWESMVGVRLFSWVAGIALVVAAIFFLRYSVENGWLTPPIRMAMGMAAGAGLLVACERYGSRYPVTANALDAAGIATLFATSFAGHALWHLIPTWVAFGLLILTTTTAVLLSLRRDSLFIALLGLIGGFATPVLLSTGEDNPFGLFGYLLLLTAGLGVVAHRKRWPHLIAASVALTALYQWGWLAKFVLGNPTELSVAVPVFLVFPVAIAVLHWIGRRWHDEDDEQPEYRLILSVSSVFPLALAICMAFVPAFGARYALLFGYLLVLDIGLLALDALRPKESLSIVGGGATFLTLAIWLARSYDADAWPAILGFVAAFVLIFVAAPSAASRVGRPLSRWAEMSSHTGPIVLFAFPVLAWIEPDTASPWILFGALFALMVVVAAFAIASERGSLHFLATFFGVAAEAAWSERHLDASRIESALALYLVFAFLYLGVPAVARRLGRPLRPEGSGSVLLLTSLLLLLFLAGGPAASASLWGIGLLLVVLNAGIFSEATRGRARLVSVAGVAISWCVIGVLWYRVMEPTMVVPALIVAAAVGLVALAGNASVLVRGEADTDGSGVGQAGMLGLVGHGFLLIIATQPSLSTPPWPMLAVLLVLDLGVLVFSLYTGRAAPLAVALILSPFIVATWVIVAEPHVGPGLSWGEVAILSNGVLGALALGSFCLMSRRHTDEPLVLISAEVALALGLATTALVGGMPSSPHIAEIIAAQAAILVVSMAVARHHGHHLLVLAALLPVAVGQMAWAIEHFEPGRFHEELWIATVPYVLFSVYPVFCGVRARTSRLPFIVALVAAGPAFLSAYHAMTRGHLRSIIGVLPIALATVTAGLLVYLLKWLEPAGPRDKGRLALVAGIALGFVTMAIPLQLENEWITIAWALEAAALAWLYVRVDHPGLLAAAFALAATVAVRLTVNPAVFEYHPRTPTPIFNWYLYTYLVAGVALYVAAAFAHRAANKPPWGTWAGWLMSAGATLLLFLLVNIEIADYFSTGTELTFKFSGSLSQDLTYTLCWGLFAIAMLAVGVFLHGRAARIAALLLLTATSAKCFLHDLWRLGGLYRVASFVGLAVCLALVAIVLQRFVLPANTSRARKPT